MPYLKRERKEDLLRGAFPLTGGDLNFLFTDHIQDFLAVKGESYETFNSALGALFACGLELYRRKVIPYEDKKIRENGDVYPPVSR